MQNARDILLATSRRLNEGIRALEATVESGGPASAEIEEIRREAGEALDGLRAVQGASGVVGDTIPKVIQHLDLFMEVAASAESAPSLSRKLLRHLLDEQLELTAEAERDGAAAASPAAGQGALERAAAGRPVRRPVDIAGGGDQEKVSSAARESTARPGMAAAAPGGAGSSLPGGRRALTVGSLIGR